MKCRHSENVEKSGRKSGYKSGEEDGPQWIEFVLESAGAERGGKSGTWALGDGRHMLKV